MAQSQSFIDPILLADQSPWVLALARSLVRDPSGAADVAQETLLAGLAAPPQDANDPRRLRAWLGRVVFNLAHLSTRRSIRRRAREESVARPERQSSAADTAIRKSVLRQVGVAVEDLREPYRSVVVMRYFDGLSTAAIAEASQTSESAVRKRLWRARVQLRQDLELQHNGERQAWFMAAMPLFGLELGTRSQPVAGSGLPALGVKLALAAAGLLVLLTPWGFFADPAASVGSRLEPANSAAMGRTSLGSQTSQPAAFLGYLQVDPLPDGVAPK